MSKKKLRKIRQILKFDPTNLNVQKKKKKFQRLKVYSRKTENVPIPFKGVNAKNVAKIVQFSFFCCKMLKSNDYRSWPNYRFFIVKKRHPGSSTVRKIV